MDKTLQKFFKGMQVEDVKNMIIKINELSYIRREIER
jgi:hypothetical protein